MGLEVLLLVSCKKPDTSSGTHLKGQKPSLSHLERIKGIKGDDGLS